MAYICLKCPQVFPAQTRHAGIRVCSALDPVLLKAQSTLLTLPPPQQAPDSGLTNLDPEFSSAHIGSFYTTHYKWCWNIKRKYTPCLPGVYCLVGVRETSRQRKTLNLSTLGSAKPRKRKKVWVHVEDLTCMDPQSRVHWTWRNPLSLFMG